MADNKKYYWLKLKRDFFKRHDIRIIEEMPNGKDYILFYLKLLLESIDHEGALRFSDTIPYNEQMLSVITNTNIDIVRSAMKIFVELHMIDVLEDQTIYMNEVEKLIGSETAAAEKMRLSRQRKRALTQPKSNEVITTGNNVTKCYPEIELEKEKDIELELESINVPQAKRNAPTKRQRFIPPTLEEVTAYCNERKNNINPQRFIDHYTANGWKVGRNKMQDWKAAVRTWESIDKENSKGKTRKKKPLEKVPDFFDELNNLYVDETEE